jgi:hypothetical protein
MKEGIGKMASEGVWKKAAGKYWVTQEKTHPQQKCS